jgi:uncharacterized protein (TIGR02996 family)
MWNILLGAIREQPDDDLARLACADWLEEQGDVAHARFIRAQLEQASQPVCSTHGGELAVESEALAAEHERGWLGEWSDRLVRWSFRRGFLDSVTLEPEVFLAHGEDLFARHPVREVRFVTGEGLPCGPEVADELVTAPWFRHVRDLNVSGSEPSAGPAWCRALARAGHVQQLEKLNVSSGWKPEGTFNDLGALTALCEAGHLAGLRKLDLSAPMAQDALGDEALEPLLHAPFTRNLRLLGLAGLQLSDHGARTLARSRSLAGLEELDLGWCEQLSREALQALNMARSLRNLKELTLGGDIDLSALARSPLLANLERLDICTRAMLFPRDFGNSGWRALGQSPHVGKLRRMSLLHSIIDPAGCEQLFHTPGLLRLHSLMILGTSSSDERLAERLANAPALAGLTALELIGCGVTHQGASELLRAPFVPALRQFCLAGNSIGARGVQHVLRSPLSLGGLNDLHLHHCGLTAKTLCKVFAWPGLANVVRLELAGNQLDREALTALAQSPHLGRLVTLHIGSGVVDAEGLKALAKSKALPRLRDLTILASADDGGIAALRRRFGARLTVDERG